MHIASNIAIVLVLFLMMGGVPAGAMLVGLISSAFSSSDQQAQPAAPASVPLDKV